MSRTIVICEKPSQARALSAALGTRFGPVLPARGHIVTLCEPQEVREDWKDWSAGLMWTGAFIPKRAAQDADKRRRLDAIAKAVKTASEVIIATDCDREGQLIGDEILDFVGYRGRRTRAIFNAEDPVSLRSAFDALRNNAEFAGMYAAGQAREQADQAANLSLTRTATVTLKEGRGGPAIGIGRVKTPTLGIVCRREREIETFVPRTLYAVAATVSVADHTITLVCDRMGDEEAEDGEGAEDDDDSDADGIEAVDPLAGRILDPAVADDLAARAIGHEGPIAGSAEQKRRAPPRLPDLTALQAAASAKLGWAADKVLQTAQALYEKTLITYPRADAQHLPETHIADTGPMVPALLRLAAFAPHASLLAQPVIRTGKSGAFCDQALAGMSHHAIVPNVNTAATFPGAVPALPPDELALFELIAGRYLAALAPDHRYIQREIRMQVPLDEHIWTFRARGRTTTHPGWTAILESPASRKPPDSGEDQKLPDLPDGTRGTITSTAVRSSVTRPPPRFTDGTLMTAMKQVWRLVPPDSDLNRKIRARLRDASGIGTQATRAEVVKGLVAQKQLVRHRKLLKPTPAGMQVYDTLLQACPDLLDPGRTAVWEILFTRVEKGEISAEQAVETILADTKRSIQVIAQSEVRITMGAPDKPSPAMRAAVEAAARSHGADVPPEALKDRAAARAFLDAHGRKDDAGGPRPPSEKQLAFARSLAQRTGTEIPGDALNNAKALSAWIDAARTGAPPSEKQLTLARRLATEREIALPDEVLASASRLSAWIDTHLGAGTGSRRGDTRRAHTSSPTNTNRRKSP
ncbi:MAG: DNA topoisomerase [Alphaproteobacteria bacterium]|nr:DNA topoisomerase [Alphaproteobacteria bacterium]